MLVVNRQPFIEKKKPSIVFICNVHDIDTKEVDLNDILLPLTYTTINLLKGKE